MSTVADRVRRHRQRQAAGRILIAIEADEVQLVGLLVESGLLSPLAADEPQAIAAAVEKLLRTLTAEGV